MDLESRFQQEFKCPKCGGVGAVTKELAMTGTGFSKVFDIQNNHFLFVSCRQCGFTEVYNSRILGRDGTASTVIDVLFGR